jgi:drug/metabolite transporter (DMT)-like permease
MEAPDTATRRETAGGLRPYLWMLCGSASFACMGAFSRAATPQVDWRIIALARAALMLGFAFALARLQGVTLLFLRPRALWWRSLAGSGALMCTFYAYTHLPLPDATSLIYMTPVWIAVLSWPLLGERPSLRILAAVLVAVGGVYLVARPHFAVADLGVAAGVSSSLFTALAMLGLHKLAGTDPRAVVVHFSAVATVATSFLFVTGGPDFAAVSGRDAVSLVALAGAGTVGQIAITRAFATGHPARVSLVALVQIPFTVVLEALFWPRPYDAFTLAGMALIVAPTAWILIRKAST